MMLAIFGCLAEHFIAAIFGQREYRHTRDHRKHVDGLSGVKYLAIFTLLVPIFSSSAWSQGTVTDVNASNPTATEEILPGRSGFFTTTFFLTNTLAGGVATCQTLFNDNAIGGAGFGLSIWPNPVLAQCSYIVGVPSQVFPADVLRFRVCLSWTSVPQQVCGEVQYLGLVANSLPSPSLTVSLIGNGTVTSSPVGINCGGDCEENYAEGTVVTLTATPDSSKGWSFNSWGGDGGCTGTGNCVVTMDADKNVEVVFFAPNSAIDNQGVSGDKNNASGVPDPVDSTGEDPIEITSGAYFERLKVIRVNGAIPVEVYLDYDSRKAAQGVGAGFGGPDQVWRHNYDIVIKETVTDNVIEIRWPSGRTGSYMVDMSDSSSFLPDTADEQDILIKNGDGSYTLSDRHHWVYDFDSGGLLTKFTDRNGFVLNLTYVSNKLDKVTEPISGRFISFGYDANDRLSSLTSTGAGTATFNFDTDGNLLSFTNAEGEIMSFTYDGDHQILTKTNGIGNVVMTNTYDSNFRVLTQDDALGTSPLSSISYSTDGGGFPVSTLTNRTGNTHKYTVDGLFRVKAFEDALNNTTAFNYDSDGNITSRTDVLGQTRSYTYDAQGYLTSGTDENGNTTNYEYDSDHNFTKVTFADTSFRTTTYDARRNVTSVIDENGDTTTYTYHGNGLLASRVLPSTATRTYTYTNGLLTSETDETGNTTTFLYDTAGRRTRRTDPAGKQWNRTYDLVGRVLTESDPLGNTHTYIYDNAGRLDTYTDPRTNVTDFTYNNNDKLIQIEDALNQMVNITFDHEDRLKTVTDERGKVTTLTYDAKGRLVGSTDPENNSLTLVYDVLDRLIGGVDALNNTSSFTYDPGGRLKTAESPLTFATSFDYDKRDRIVQTTDSLGHETVFEYDSVGQHTKTVDALLNESTQVFEQDQLRTSFTDANANTTTFTYDNATRVIGIQTSDGGSVAFTYNTRGLSQTFTNARSQVGTYTYDDASRLTGYTDPASTITYTYDFNGNQLTASDAVGTITRVYDVLDRVTSFTDVFGNVIGYTYDAAGNLKTLTYPGAKVVTYAYDDADRLASVTDWNSRVTAYTWDANSRLSTITHPNGIVTTYNYDIDNRLTYQEERKSDNTLIHKYDFTYDTVGNIQVEDDFPSQVPSPSTDTFTYGTDNRLATFNTETVVHDADGNMTTGPLSGDLKTYAYDARNQLTSVDGTTYTYDAEDRRVATTASGTIRYVIDPHGSLSRTLMETDNTGTATAYYVYGVGLIGREAAVGGAYRTYHYDYRGSTRILTDSSANTTDNYFYDPFGELVSSTTTTDQPFRYNGRDGVITDTNGLYHMRARYYLPEAKRFINRDTLLGDIQDILTLNRFAYVTGDPIRLVDPLGLSEDSTKKPTCRQTCGTQTKSEFFRARLRKALGFDKMQKNIDRVVDLSDDSSEHSKIKKEADADMAKGVEETKKVADATVTLIKGPSKTIKGSRSIRAWLTGAYAKVLKKLGVKGAKKAAKAAAKSTIEADARAPNPKAEQPTIPWDIKHPNHLILN